MEYLFKVSVPSGVAVSYYEGKGPFYVVGVLNLNKRPELREPVELKQEGKVKTLLSEGDLSFTIRLPQRGYAVGEHIRLKQEIKNGSKQAVKASVSLVQVNSAVEEAELRIHRISYGFCVESLYRKSHTILEACYGWIKEIS
jgi:hypothetical protein